MHRGLEHFRVEVPFNKNTDGPPEDSARKGILIEKDGKLSRAALISLSNSNQVLATRIFDRFHHPKESGLPLALLDENFLGVERDDGKFLIINKHHIVSIKAVD